MYKRVLFAVDLEGVNRVVGEAYMSLHRDSDEWNIARHQAALEINAASEALFALGVEKIGVWDNHGSGNNIDASSLDPRLELIAHVPPRMSFIDGEYDCICYFGYHAMEGTFGGVLAHTMSSKSVQHYKLNGKYIGEVDMDAYIAASYGVPSCFFAGGDIAVSQAKRAVPSIVTVITKFEKGRNRAIFRDNEELFADIKKNIVLAVSEKASVNSLTFPSVFEKSFKRVEDAEKYLLRLQKLGIDAAYPDDEILGKDAHTVVSCIHSTDEFIKCI